MPGRLNSIRRGFTLVELMVVMVLIAIVGAVVVPAFLKSAVVDPMTQATMPIIQLLKFGKKMASESGAEVRVMIDPATGRYLVTGSQIDTVLAAGQLELPVSTRIVADSSRAKFLFDPTGIVMGDSLLISSSGGSAIIRVNRWTGAINVSQW